MKFNDLIKVYEDFYAPIGTKEPVLKSKGKYGTVNPQLNKSHSTKSISGFKGQPGGKKKTVYVVLPKKGSTKGKQST